METTPQAAQPDILPEEKDARLAVLNSPEYMQVKARNLEFMDPARFQLMRQLAQTFVESGAMPKDDNAPRVLMKMQAGFERNMTPVEAINSFYFVGGRIAIFGESAIRQVLKMGHKVKWGKCDANSATVTIVRADTGEEMTQTFSMEEASARGYTSRNPQYQKFPENMLKFRAFGMVARFLVPDALGGIPIKEDIEGIGHVLDEDGTEVAKVRVAAAEKKTETARNDLRTALQAKPEKKKRAKKAPKATVDAKEETTPSEGVSDEPTVEELPDAPAPEISEEEKQQIIREEQEAAKAEKSGKLV